MVKIKKGDEVFVISGKNRGKRGKVHKVLRGKNAAKVVVEGVNVVKKHQKPNPGRNITGGIVEREAAIAISNVALFNPITNKPDKIGIRMLDDGRKVRYFKSNNELVDI
jgi:large subunit ribosomal protein L24